jgi:hypothetical protein
VLVLRCTKKLLDRIGRHAPSEREPGPSTTRLGDWTANLFIIRRQQVVLAVNNRTLLPVLIPIAPNTTFLSRVVEASGEMLMALGVDRKEALSEMTAMNDCTVAPTNDRRVLGTINDFGRMLEAYLDGRPLPEVALHLAEAPCGPIGMERPMDVARETFERRPSTGGHRSLRL